MIIEFNEEHIVTLVKAMRTALQHEQEAVATGNVDVFEVGKIKHVLSLLEDQVSRALANEYDRRFKALGFRQED